MKNVQSEVAFQMTNNKWIVDVLGDIASIANENGLTSTSNSVLETMITASEEISRQKIGGDNFVELETNLVPMARVR